MAVVFPATSFFHCRSSGSTRINHNNSILPLPKPLFSLGFSVSCTRYCSNRTILSSPVRRLSPPFPCRAAKPGPPESDPPPRLTGLAASLSKFQDRIQIFFAVLFWMSLFFWTCAWDERNRPNKGSRFRR